MLNISISVIVIAVVGIQSPAIKPDRESNKYSPAILKNLAGAFLVAGKVTSVAPLEPMPKYYSNLIPVEVRITHVYFGDQSLEGKSFRDYQRDPRGSYFSASTSAWPAYTVNEVGIWRIINNDDQWEVGPFHSDPMLPYRTRKATHEDVYKQVLEVANAIERLGALSMDHQRAGWMKLVRSKNSKLSSCAIQILAQDSTREAAVFLRKLIANPPPFQLSYWALDRAIANKEQHKWLISDDRVTFLAKCVDGEPTMADADIMLMLTGFLVQASNDSLFDLRLDPKVAANLICTAATNKKLSAKVRERALNLLPAFPRRCGIVKPVLPCLIKIVASEKSIGLRQLAARQLLLSTANAKNPGMITEEVEPIHADTIAKMIETEQDKKVSDSLKAALVNLTK